MAMAMQGTRRNALRFQLLEDLEMDRLFFSRHILQKELGTTTNQLDFVFAFPGKKIVEVVFTSLKSFESCIKEFDRKKSTPAFRNIAITPLTEVDRKIVHVVILSERVRMEDIKTWMSHFCDVITASEVVDIDGIKTGARHFEVKLRRENWLLKHLPNQIQLGTFRGSVVYPGQPKKCVVAWNTLQQHALLPCAGIVKLKITPLLNVQYPLNATSAHQNLTCSKIVPKLILTV